MSQSLSLVMMMIRIIAGCQFCTVHKPLSCIWMLISTAPFAVLRLTKPTFVGYVKWPDMSRGKKRRFGSALTL